MQPEQPKKGLGLAAMIKNFDKNSKQGETFQFSKITDA